MKTLGRIMRNPQGGLAARCYALLVTTIVWTSGALLNVCNAQGVGSSAAHPPQITATNQQPSTATSLGINEILQLADAGVSTEVIKAYIEYSPTAYDPTGADLIALKKHNVADEIVTLLLKKAAQVRTALAQAKSDALAKALSARRGHLGLDPESYEFFQYYYLQPRALASAYERLSPYYNSSFVGPFGYPPNMFPGGSLPASQLFPNR